MWQRQVNADRAVCKRLVKLQCAMVALISERTLAMHRRHFLAFATFLSITACGKKGDKAKILRVGSRVLALGDSLTAGNGAGSGESWPAQLGLLTGWLIDNQGVSGDTSEDALKRLPALLAAQRYDAILIGIGGNDMLQRRVRGETIGRNIRSIVRRASEHTSHVALIATPSPSVTRAATGTLKDSPMYAGIAREEGVLLLDNVYARVLSDAALRSDQIHANAKGYAEMARLFEGKLKAAGWCK